MVKTKKSKSANEGWISWRSSIPKCVLIEDLTCGFLAVDEKQVFADAAWEMYYEHHPDFEDVVFLQFKARLRDHRRQVKNGLLCSKKEERAIKQDLKLLGPQNEASIFDKHPARDLLREDIAAKLHMGVQPLLLWSYDKEYQEFSLDIFWQRIYQTVWQEKFINWLQIQQKKGKMM